MTAEILTLNLQDLETLIAKNNCSCHFINPSKTRIILWKEIKDQQEIYYLRIGVQKFISYPLTDKNKDPYWRFKNLEKQGVHSELSQKEEISSIPNSDPNNPITKFNQRVSKALNHGQSNNSEPSVDSSTN